MVGSIHLFHEKCPIGAATFSLGVSDSETSYSVGPTLRLGSKGAISLQGHLAQVDRLPAGIEIGDVATNANILNNLGKKTDIGLALTFSYKFLKVGDFFKKPFAPHSDSPSSTN